MKLTRATFELIAKVIRESNIDIQQKRIISEDFMYELYKTNSNFKRQKFLDACLGVNEE